MSTMLFTLQWKWMVDMTVKLQNGQKSLFDFWGKWSLWQNCFTFHLHNSADFFFCCCNYYL